MNYQKPTMLLTDIRDVAPPCEATLRAFFNLTPAEALVAQGIARGESLKRIADRLGIKMPTVRTQLASVFAKTETRRQTKLVAILARLSLHEATTELRMTG